MKKNQPDPSQIKNFDKRLQELNTRHDRNPDGSKKAVPKEGKNSGYGNAMRLSSEFISAILVGAALGYGIDYFVGTTPWAMVVFLLLGFVAGVVNVLRAAGEFETQGKSPTQDERSEQ